MYYYSVYDVSVLVTVTRPFSLFAGSACVLHDNVFRVFVCASSNKKSASAAALFAAQQHH
jgi:hypothetical protein